MSDITTDISTFGSFSDSFKKGTEAMKTYFSGTVSLPGSESACEKPVTNPWRTSSTSTPQVPPGLHASKPLLRQQAVRKVRRVPSPRVPIELDDSSSDLTSVKPSTLTSETTGWEVVASTRKFPVQRRVPPPPYTRVPGPVSSPRLSKKIDTPSVSPISLLLYKDSLTVVSQKSPVAEAVNGLKAIRIIGHGGFAKVYDAEIGTTGKHMAVKLLDKAKLWNKFGEAGLETITQEQTILRKIAELEIEGCTKLLLSAHDEQFAIMGTEYYPLGDVSKELERSGRLPERFASFVFASVALTLEKLAAKNIIHRDMKPQNVVWANDDTPKIIDFGLAVIPKGPLIENCGTDAYIAPEVANREGYGSEVDEWSWEVSHFEMVTGVLPFGRLGAGATNEPLIILPFHQLSEDAEDYFRKVLDKNRKTRMAWKEAKNHPYIKKMVADISDGRITTPPFVPIRQAAMPLGFTFTIPTGSAYAPGQDPHPNFSFQAPDLYTPLIPTSSFTTKLSTGKRSVSALFSKALGKNSVPQLSLSPAVAPPTTAISIYLFPAKTSPIDLSKSVPKLFGRIKGWMSRSNVDAIAVWELI